MPPSLIPPNTPIYVHFKHASVTQIVETEINDSGACYLTDQNLYVLGRSQDWTFALQEIQKADFSFEGWKLSINNEVNPIMVTGGITENEMDAQLFCAVIETLKQSANS